MFLKTVVIYILEYFSAFGLVVRQVHTFEICHIIEFLKGYDKAICTNSEDVGIVFFCLFGFFLLIFDFG